MHKHVCNDLLKAKYENDTKYARIHKRLLETGKLSKRESEICNVLLSIKKEIDLKVLMNTQMLNNENYFDTKLLEMVFKSLGESKIKIDVGEGKFIKNLLFNE